MSYTKNKYEIAQNYLLNLENEELICLKKLIDIVNNKDKEFIEEKLLEITKNK